MSFVQAMKVACVSSLKRHPEHQSVSDYIAPYQTITERAFFREFCASDASGMCLWFKASPRTSVLHPAHTIHDVGDNCVVSQDRVERRKETKIKPLQVRVKIPFPSSSPRPLPPSSTTPILLSHLPPPSPFCAGHPVLRSL